MVLISRSITKQFTCTLAGLAALQGCMGSTTCALHAAQINPDKNKPSAVHLTTNQVPYYKLAINEEGRDKYPGDYPLPATAHTDRCPVLAVKQLQTVAFHAAIDLIVELLRPRWVIAGGYAHARLRSMPKGMGNLSHWCAYAPGNVWSNGIGRGGQPAETDFDEAKAFSDLDFFYVGSSLPGPQQISCIAARDYGLIQYILNAVTGSRTRIKTSRPSDTVMRSTAGWETQFDRYQDQPLLTWADVPFDFSSRIETDHFPSVQAAPIMHIFGKVTAIHRMEHGYDSLGKTNNWKLLHNTASSCTPYVPVQMISATFGVLKSPDAFRAANTTPHLNRVLAIDHPPKRCLTPESITGQFDLTCCAVWIESTKCNKSSVVIGCPSSRWLELTLQGKGQITARALCARLPLEGMAPDNYDVHITKRTFKRLLKYAQRQVIFSDLPALKRGNQAFTSWSNGGAYYQANFNIVRDLQTRPDLAPVPIQIEAFLHDPTDLAYIEVDLLLNTKG